MTRLIDADSIPWDVEGVGEIPVITKDEIDQMPTVDAVQWIPVSERLPKNEKWVVVSFYRPHEIDPEDGYEYDERRWTGVGSYSKKFGRFYATDDIGETGDEVIAWMPLPEPYKAERKEDDQTD